MNDERSWSSSIGFITVAGAERIEQVFGSRTPGVLTWMSVILNDGRKTIVYMMDANNLYKAIVAQRPEIIEEWRTRTGIDSF